MASESNTFRFVRNNRPITVTVTATRNSQGQVVYTVTDSDGRTILLNGTLAALSTRLQGISSNPADQTVVAQAIDWATRADSNLQIPVAQPTPATNSAAQQAEIEARGGAIDAVPNPAPSNAIVTPTGSPTEQPARTVTATESQAPNGNTVVNRGQLILVPSDDFNQPVGPSGDQPGAAAGNEDSQQNSVQRRVDSLYLQNQTVTPQLNILDKYASYTYNISVYLMSPQSYKSFVTSKRKFFEANTLLFQSGGAPPAVDLIGYDNQVDSSGSLTIKYPIPSKNPYFAQDFFIDNVEIKNIISGKGQGSAHNSSLLNFTVTEYNGITLLQNLDRAVIDYIYKGDPKLKLALQQNPDLGTWGSQIYMMAIRFYGYDDNGNLVAGGTNSPDFQSDPQAVVEKYIPFVVRNITFKVGNRAVEYQWDCASPATMINTGPNFATVPYNCQLSGKSLSDALGGSLQTVYQPIDERREAQTQPNGVPDNRDVQPIDYGQATKDMQGTPLTGTGMGLPQALASTTPPQTGARPAAPPKIDAKRSTSETVTQGLMAAMNRYQQEILNLGQIQIANRYSVEFSSPVLSDAKLTYRGRVDRDLAPTADSDNPRNLLTETQAVDLDKKIFSVTAGQQLVQVIEMLIRNSTYISDQQLVIIDPKTGVQTPNPGRTKNLAWFKINMTATPIGYDFKRKDYAWDIKYIISEYRIVLPQTGYFPIVDFPGFHKSYPYWFTGENTAIINFEQKYNFQYSRVLSGGILTDSTSANYQDFGKTVFYPRSGQSTQGGPLRTNEAAANAADYFYSPGDQKTVELEIVGDPAWIFQGEASGSFNLQLANVNPFLPDGTINVDYGQIFFEISWNSPEDYDVNGNGLINPIKNITQTGNAKLNTGIPKQSYAYGARTCTSIFRRGVFTQNLDGYLVIKNLNSKINSDNQREIVRQLVSSDIQLLNRVAPDIAREENARADRALVARVTAAGRSTTVPPPQSPASSVQPDSKTNQNMAKDA